MSLSKDRFSSIFGQNLEEAEELSEMELQSIAERLLEEKLLLTALELHAELLERGKGLQSLKDFFENPSNFESFTRKLEVEPSPAPSVSGMNKSGSQATLDSLSLFDLGRYSEDSHPPMDDRLAVLEFELRKARETINYLRNELTQQADHGGTPRQRFSESEDDLDERSIVPLEKRTLNYLVNEYLLQYGFKLTSITFSDENSDEDFEDWDSIGLNVPKPPCLLRLYRDFGQHTKPVVDVSDGETQTTPADSVGALQNKIRELTERIAILTESNSTLKNDLHEKTEEIDSLQQRLTASEAESASVRAELQKAEQALLHSNPTVPDREDGDGASVQDSPSIDSITQEEIPENIPPSLLDHLRSKCLPVADDPSCQEPLTNDNVVNVVAEALPNIVPNVILAKREELLPLLLIAIQLHPDVKQRDKLLNLLFNLIKRPDVKQRQMILRGFRAIAREFGATRIEAELLPQCWEQLDHKYPERRVLVAETCAALMPYIPETLRVSLVFSMLQQLALEDREVEVRCGAIRAMALLITFIKNDDRFTTLLDLVAVLLKDPSEAVVDECQQTLLVALANLSRTLGVLESKLVTDRVSDLVQHSELLDSVCDQFSGKVRSLELLLPFVMKSVIENGPTPLPPATDPTAEPFDIPSEHLRAFHEYTSREWFEAWPQLKWLTTFFVKEIITVSSRIPVHQHTTMDIYIGFLQRLCQYLGPVLTERHLVTGFKDHLKMPSIDSIGDGDDVFGRAMLPIFLLGVKRVFATVPAFIDELKEWSIFYSVTAFNKDPVLFAIAHSLDLKEPLCTDLAWALIVHSNPKIRCFAAIVLDRLASALALDSDLIGQRILPGLVTLASDPDRSVRVAAISGLGTVLASSTDFSIQEKACLQLITSLDEDSNLETLIEFTRTFGRIVGAIPKKARDDVLLPRIGRIASSDTADRLDLTTALIAAFGSVVPLPLPVPVAHTHVIPALRALETSASGASVDMTRQMISDLETRYGPPAAEAKSIMSSSPSMDEMKSKMGKIFQKSGGPNTGPFWKK